MVANAVTNYTLRAFAAGLTGAGLQLLTKNDNFSFTKSIVLAGFIAEVALKNMDGFTPFLRNFLPNLPNLFGREERAPSYDEITGAVRQVVRTNQQQVTASYTSGYGDSESTGPTTSSFSNPLEILQREGPVKLQREGPVKPSTFAYLSSFVLFALTLKFSSRMAFGQAFVSSAVIITASQLLKEYALGMNDWMVKDMRRDGRQAPSFFGDL